MEELNDDELQQRLSQGAVSADHNLSEKEARDVLAYEDLFKALETAPSGGLSFSFASNVRRKLQDQLNRKNDIRFNILAFTIFVLSLLLGFGILHLMNQTLADLVLHTVLKFKWILLAVICLFFCLLAVDQLLVKREY